MEQPVPRNSFQSLAAGIMLVEPQQSSDNSLCSHPLASKQTNRELFATNSKKIDFDRSGLREIETKNEERDSLMRNHARIKDHALFFYIMLAASVASS